jgi:hypothetical protein
MRNVKVIVKQLARLWLVLMMGVSMNADAGWLGLGLGLGGDSWKEEVQLHDGGVLLIERFFKLGGYPTLDARERRLLEESFTFTLPGSKQKVVWKSVFDNTVPEPNSLGPLLLDIVGGVLYLATSPAGCIAYNKWGRPNPPYILFKYANGAWQSIPLKEFPAELVQANLINMPASDQLKPYYNVEAVKAKLADGKVSDYAKKILRDVVTVSDGITSCEILVNYKCGWGAPGEFNRKYFEHICK